MHNVLNGSLIMRALGAAAGWVDSQFRKSPLAKAFLKETRGQDIAQGGVFPKLRDGLHGVLCAVFKALRLDRVFAGSVFARLSFWCLAAVALAPMIPTLALLGLVLLAFAAFFIRLGLDRELKLPYSPANVFVYLFAFVYLICAFTSVTFKASLPGGLLSFAFILFSVVLTYMVKTQGQQDKLIALVVIAGAVVAAYGIFQSIVGFDSNTDWIDEEKFSSFMLRVYSTFENPNVLAEYLLLVTPLAVSFTFTEKAGWKRASGLIASAALFICMFLSYSRGGYLGLAAAAALFLILLDRRFIVLGIIGAAALLLVMPESIVARMASITDLSDSSTSYRISIWLATLAMLRDYWFCGIGTGISAFSAVYPAYSFNAVAAPHSHNLFLQVTCECGICGILLLSAVIFVFFRTAARALVKKPERTKRLRLIALISGMFGFLVQGMTDYSFYNYRVMFMFWVFVALGMIVSRDKTEDAA